MAAQTPPPDEPEDDTYRRAQIQPAQGNPPEGGNTVGKVIEQTEYDTGPLLVAWNDSLPNTLEDEAKKEEREVQEDTSPAGEHPDDITTILPDRALIGPLLRSPLKPGGKLAAPQAAAKSTAPQTQSAAAPKGGSEAGTVKQTARTARGSGGGYNTGSKARPDCGQVGAYRERKQYRNRGDKASGEENMNWDHVPSRAALRQATQSAIEARDDEGTKISPSLAKSITNAVANNAPTAVIPEGVHMKGNSWGGKNTQTRISTDAGDLNAAAKRDTEAISRAMKDKDDPCKEVYDKATQVIRDKNWNQYIQDTIDSFVNKTSKGTK